VKQAWKGERCHYIPPPDQPATVAGDLAPLADHPLGDHPLGDHLLGDILISMPGVCARTTPVLLLTLGDGSASAPPVTSPSMPVRRRSPASPGGASAEKSAAASEPAEARPVLAGFASRHQAWTGGHRIRPRPRRLPVSRGGLAQAAP
jgi:hypothetical protein